MQSASYATKQEKLLKSKRKKTATSIRKLKQSKLECMNVIVVRYVSKVHVARTTDARVLLSDARPV